MKKDNLLKAVKQAILQEAIQGKLTEDWRKENPDVEPASELLKRIKAEKEKLIKEKKIRKEKPLPPITEEEISFELPRGWVWCRLGKIAINRDELRKPISKKERENKRKLYDYYGASGKIDMIDGYTHCGSFLLIGEDGSNLRLRATPIAFEVNGKFWVNNHAHSIQFINNITQKYIKDFLNGIDLTPYITGGFQPKLSQNNLNKILISLPPLAEQKAIVEKVEKLFEQAEDISQGANPDDFEIVDKKAYQLLKNYGIIKNIFDEITKQKEYIIQLKQSILQEAIQGKLTEDWREENPDVEPASKLLKRIKAEKEKLIKEKKIRKEKPLPPITEEEIPFELPQGWIWCRLGEIGITQTGTTPPKNNNSYYGDYIPFIQPSNITDSGLNFNCIYLSKKGIEKSRFIPKYSNLMVCIGGSAGKTCYNEIDVTCNQQINTITGLSEIDYKFLDIVLKSPHFFNSVWDTIKQGSTPILNKGNWSKIAVPICSTFEQKIIVEKVESLMQKVSLMEEEIQKSEQNAKMLMQAVLREAFEGKKE